jgi:hypothetical protein
MPAQVPTPESRHPVVDRTETFLGRVVVGAILSTPIGAVGELVAHWPQDVTLAVMGASAVAYVVNRYRTDEH